MKILEQFSRYSRGYTKWCKQCLKEALFQKNIDSWVNSHIDDLINQNATKPPKMPRVQKTPLELFCTELYHNTKKRALRLNREFSIEKDFLIELVTNFCSKNHHDLNRKNPFRPSIDRVSLSEGYTSKNIRIVWLMENLCKNVFTDQQVIEFCKRKLKLM
jgi:hypothetical protein